MFLEDTSTSELFHEAFLINRQQWEKSHAQILFTSRKSKTNFSSLGSIFLGDLKTNVVKKLSCWGSSSYVGQFGRPLATRIEEHKKEVTAVGIHIRQCREEATTAQLSCK